MNLNSLSTNEMLFHSKLWLEDPELRARITAHPIGAALLPAVDKAHVRLAQQTERRRQNDIELAQLTELLADLDLDHDNLARAIFGGLDALALGTRDPEARRRYQRLQRLLLPEGLSIVQRSYIYEAGAIEALEERMSEADLAELEGIAVGDETLADWYRAWIEAGHELGRRVHERETLLKQSGTGGSAIAAVNIRAARLEWINIVQTFLRALDLMELDQEIIERMLGSLERTIERALRNRGGAETAPGDDPAGDAPPPAPETPAEPGAEPAPPAEGVEPGPLADGAGSPVPVAIEAGSPGAGGAAEQADEVDEAAAATGSMDAPGAGATGVEPQQASAGAGGAGLVQAS